MHRIKILSALAVGVTVAAMVSCRGSFSYRIDPVPSAAERTDTNQKSLMDPLLGGELRSLSVSGGGYRAMLFGLGVMWRLNDLGILPNLDAISSVSGGSILNAYVAIHWHELHFKNPGTVFAQSADNFGDVVAAPILGLSQHTIDSRAVVFGALVPGQSAANFVARSLDCRLFRGARMESFVDEDRAPQFYLYATDLGTGEPWVWARRRSGFPGAGYRQVLPSRAIKVADAVAASAAFPPFLSPARFKFRGASERLKQEYPFLATGGSMALLPFPPQTEFLEHIDRVDLADGGLVNNLASIRCSHASRLCIVSDAANGPVRQRVWPTWIGEMNPVVEAIYNQKEALLRADDRMAFSGRGASRVSVQLTDDHWGFRLGDLRKSILQVMDAALADSSCATDSYCGNWALSVKKTWEAGYADALVLHTMETLGQHIKGAQIDTRLARVKLSEAEDIVRLGYLEADLALLDSARSRLDAVKSHASPAEAVDVLMQFSGTTSDRWLKTPLTFPVMPPPKLTTCIWPN